MDPERTIEDARSVCRDLSEIFAQDGDFSEGTLEEVERLCEIARLFVGDLCCDRELHQVERYAGHLLAGDTAQWAHGANPGDAYLRELIIELIKVVDRRLRLRALRARSENVRFKAMRARLRAREAARLSNRVRVAGVRA